MIRTYYMFVLGDAFTSDQTWQVDSLIWTIAEPGSILVCACLPVLWPMLRRVAQMPSEPTRIEGKPGTTVLLPRGGGGWRRTPPPPPPPHPGKRWRKHGSGESDGEAEAEGGYYDANNYDLELLHGVAASEVDRRAEHHDHLYLGPIRYQIRQDPLLGRPNTKFTWDASRGSPTRPI